MHAGDPELKQPPLGVGRDKSLERIDRLRFSSRASLPLLPAIDADVWLSRVLDVVFTAIPKVKLHYGWRSKATPWHLPYVCDWGRGMSFATPASPLTSRGITNQSAETAGSRSYGQGPG